jgi:Calcineurin-like phosphoesterase
MKILLLHFSDIHIKTQEDAVLQRSSKIVDAVKNLDQELQAVVCILSGDVTFAGSEDQFLLALDFVTQLKTELQRHVPAGCLIAFVAVPGNHDCDFSEASDAREVLLAAIRENPRRLAEQSFADICLAPQRRFFQFVDAIDLLPPNEKNSTDKRLYAEYRIEINGEVVVFCCCNTAALSQFHEQPGSLVFPTEIIPTAKNSAAVSIGIQHHPGNWLRPDCAREFRRRLESITDFIMTGHEHTLDKREIHSQESDNTYLEGGVLQESGNPKISEFYAVLIETETKKQRILGFSWDGESYAPLNCENPRQFHLWEDFAQNRFRLQETFQLKPEFAAHLNDPEITLTHRVRGQLHLSDIYVFPDLKRMNLTGEKGTKTIRGEGVPVLVEEKPCLFILGNDLSGKTALAKRVFDHLRSRGDVPVLIDAGSIGLSLLRCDEQIEECFLRNYVESALLAYRQLDRARRVLIIDNYHRLKLSGRGKVDLLHKLRCHSFRIIVLAHDLEITFQDLSEAGDSMAGELPFEYYSILPFSLLRRNRMVEKWLLLGGDADRDTAQFIHNLERLTRIIDTLVGKNYVPPYPAYVLAVLQATEAGTEVDLNASTHGYLYELFIKAAIAKRTSALAFNVLSAYLSHISYWMFEHQRKAITAAELRTLHEALHSRVEVLPPFERVTELLVEMQLLNRQHDSFVFRHPYIHYYFLAIYLRDRLSDADLASHVHTLAAELYKDENANTLLFLSHLSKKRIILDALLASADAQYPGAQHVTLEGDVGFLNQMHGVVGKLRLPDKPMTASRQEMIENVDAARAEELEFQEERKPEIESDSSILGRLNSALKTIQILGQFLKNFPADLDRGEKDRIIAACCSLARRALGDFIGLVQRNETEILQEMLFLIGRRKPSIDAQKLRDRAVITVVSLCELASVGMITRLSYALGSKELSATYDRLFPSFVEPIMRLVYVAIQLDHYDEFPEGLIREEGKALHKNPFGFRILRYLVARYLALFPTDFRLKQRLSELLQFEFQKVRIPKKEQQLLKV